MILVINSAGWIILLNNGFKKTLNAISQLSPFKEEIILYFSHPRKQKILLPATPFNHTYFRHFMQPCHIKVTVKNCITPFRRRKGETYPCKCPVGRRRSDFLKLLHMLFICRLHLPIMTKSNRSETNSPRRHTWLLWKWPGCFKLELPPVGTAGLPLHLAEFRAWIS